MYVHVCIPNCTLGTSLLELILLGTGVNIHTGLWEFHAQTALTLKKASQLLIVHFENASIMSPCVIDFTEYVTSTVSNRNCKYKGKGRQYFGTFVHCQIFSTFVYVDSRERQAQRI